MGAIFDIIAVPLGWLLEFIYKLVPNYFAAIFLFTLLVRLLMFPLSLKSQKSQAERAKLAPRIERIQKKYANDPKKLQEKQMALYEKEGISMTGGCLPMLLQMVVLFGIISVIYSPLKHLTDVPTPVVNAAMTAMTGEGEEDTRNFQGYYKELRILNNLQKYESDVKAEIAKIEGYDEIKAAAAYDEMLTLNKQFTFGKLSLLQNPGEGGVGGASLLWLIPLFSGLTALASSMIAMSFTKKLTSSEVKQPGQGCSNGMMMYLMPLFSLYITFTVPGGVGIYWICSNVIATVQSIVLNKIYDPAKIRAQAEIEYEERRRQKQEDKKRLAEARAREQRALAAELNEQKKPTEKKKNVQKPVETTADPVSENTEEKG